MTGLWTAGCRGGSDFIEVPESAEVAEEPQQPPVATKFDNELNPRLLRRFAPVEAVGEPLPESLVDLGRMLYFEPRLSRTGKISCNSCHPIERNYGTTDTAVSVGVDGLRGTRNAPTTFNAAGHFRQFWDGRATTLQEQAKGPIGNPVEMNMTERDVTRALSSIAGYDKLFAAAFPRDPHPISLDNVAAAIAAFERGLITPSRWDRYLRGDREALSAREKDGAKLFANLGCMVCHTGAYLGGTMFERLGVQKPWPNQKDHGRRTVSANAADDMVFKVPSLRNVARTGPYFHDGSVELLDDAIRLMARHQLGIELESSEVRSIAIWLESLTGEIPAAYVAKPQLPEGKHS